MRSILILGGTTEARLLAEALAPRSGLAVMLSLAGRTRAPVAMPGPVRSGGFGGVAGLAAWLRREGVDLLVDATHPFAAIMSGNAVAAAAETSIPLIALRRPEWQRQDGDLWTEVEDAAAAITALGSVGRRVFLTLGRQDAHVAEAAPQHDYLIRSVDPIDPPLAVPAARYLLERGPFSTAGDLALMRDAAIDVVVAKNSGGSASYGKIAAARALGLPVILIRRPTLPDVPAVATVEAAVAAIDHAFAAAERGA